MKNLQLFININARFEGEVHYLPNQLRFLDWPGCPLKSFPSNFNPKRLVTLNMPRSQISRFDEGFKSFHHLKSMNLEGCESLTEVPNWSGMFPSFEDLRLNWCTSLVELHPSVQSLEKLDNISLEGCSNLTMFPRIDNSTSLRCINLRGCTSLEHFPEIEEKMESLERLILCASGIKDLPASVRNLISLAELTLQVCQSLAHLPRSISDLQQLQRFYLTDSSKFVSFTGVSGVLPTIPESDGEASSRLPELRRFSASGCNLSETDFLDNLDCASTLESLDLSGNIFESFPSVPCIAKFVSLSVLRLNGCKRLREIPELPPRVKWLFARDCVSLERIANLSNMLAQKGSKLIKHFIEYEFH